MFYQKPIWCPNVLLLSIDNGMHFTEIEAEQIIKKMTCGGPFITVCLTSDKHTIDSKNIVVEYEDYAIYKETRSSDENLATTFVKFGSKYAYNIVMNNNSNRAAFAHIYDILGDDLPVICIADSLLEHLNPSAVIYANTDIKGFESHAQITNTLHFQTKKFILQDVKYLNSKIVVTEL